MDLFCRLYKRALDFKWFWKRKVIEPAANFRSWGDSHSRECTCLLARADTKDCWWQAQNLEEYAGANWSWRWQKLGPFGDSFDIPKSNRWPPGEGTSTQSFEDRRPWRAKLEHEVTMEGCSLSSFRLFFSAQVWKDLRLPGGTPFDVHGFGVLVLLGGEFVYIWQSSLKHLHTSYIYIYVDECDAPHRWS